MVYPDLLVLNHHMAIPANGWQWLEDRKNSWMLLQLSDTGESVF